jgi:hypothetical protein
VVAQIPAANVIQLFYRSTDNSLRSHWRNPDGSWSAEQKLGGRLSNGLLAAQVPGTNVLQIFYEGTDSAIWSRWRAADGSWSAEQRLGGAENSNLTAAVIPPDPAIKMSADSIVISLGVNLSGPRPDTGSITGSVNVTLDKTGSYNYSGSIHNTNTMTYSVSLVVMVRSSKGTVFTFGVSQTVNGVVTDPFGSHDSSWNNNGNNTAIESAWNDLQAETDYRYKWSASFDLTDTWNSLKGEIGDIATVVAVVGGLV